MAVLQLEKYRNVLENKVVGRFDRATAEGDLAGMADSCRVMAEFDGGSDCLLKVRFKVESALTSMKWSQL